MVIVDGQEQKDLNLNFGHKEGAKVLENTVRYAKDIGIKYITVYAFSTENWKRTEDEVGTLMKLLELYLNDFSKKADTENVQIKVIGNRKDLNKGLLASIEKAEDRTKNNTRNSF